MFFRSFKGIIALDIDGTVTAQAHEIDAKVIETFGHLVQEGWQLIFITGRPFQWSFQTLSSLPFSYFLAVQNGALLLEMPSRKIMIRNYLNVDILPKIQQMSQEWAIDPVIYSGLENDDQCYYLTPFHSPSILAYGLERANFLGEKWQAIPSFADLPLSHFSSIKFFTKESSAFSLSQKIEKELRVHAPPNRDPFNPDYFVIQATHHEANKGQILKEFIASMGQVESVIAAGDDYNDWSMLQAAHIKIVMANAPKELLKIADVIAPPASQRGIIQGLTEAIHLMNHR